MAKSTGPSFEVFNVPLSDFLIALAVDPEVRRRFSEAKTRKEKKAVMAKFELGTETMDAVLDDTRGGENVRSLLRISDQQALSSPAPPTSFRSKNPSKKR